MTVWEEAASIRTPDTANSLAKIRATTHRLQTPSRIMYTKATVVSSLSARGSANLPKSVTIFHLRARYPSRKSVKLARANTTPAARYQPD